MLFLDFILLPKIASEKPLTPGLSMYGFLVDTISFHLLCLLLSYFYILHLFLLFLLLTLNK